MGENILWNRMTTIQFSPEFARLHFQLFDKLVLLLWSPSLGPILNQQLAPQISHLFLSGSGALGKYLIRWLLPILVCPLISGIRASFQLLPNMTSALRIPWPTGIPVTFGRLTTKKETWYGSEKFLGPYPIPSSFDGNASFFIQIS